MRHARDGACGRACEGEKGIEGRIITLVLIHPFILILDHYSLFL